MQHLFDQNANLVQKMISIEEQKDKYKESLEEIKAKTGYDICFLKVSETDRNFFKIWWKC